MSVPETDPLGPPPKLASGPLHGVRVIEIAGLGAAPFGAMMLADMGAEVIRIDRLGGADIMAWTVALNLKREGAVQAVLGLIDTADVLLEAFRPGVMERLGLGPQVCLARKPALVYGRMTGWGQEGPLAQAAGHDINYVALSGVLHAIGEPDRPPRTPMNLIGDFGGGGMLLAFGVVCALLSARSSGKGQVVDAAMVDGSALLASMTWGLFAEGRWNLARGTNTNDCAAHYYGAYECADGKFISIASAEPQFYALLREKAGLQDAAFDAQNDQAQWPALKARVAALFRTRTRADWCDLMEGSDVCFAPVLDWNEAPHHPHAVAREAFVRVEGVLQPRPAPRFSGTPPPTPRAPVAIGADSLAVLREAGFDAARIAQLQSAGALAAAPAGALAPAPAGALAPAPAGALAPAPAGAGRGQPAPAGSPRGHDLER
jgi:alpha-methylacyl-CoA racemase